MQGSRSDEELIRSIRAQTRRHDAHMLRDMGSHTACTCLTKYACPSEHNGDCPIFQSGAQARALRMDCSCKAQFRRPDEHSAECPVYIWHSAAHALEFMAQD